MKEISNFSLLEQFLNHGSNLKWSTKAKYLSVLNMYTRWRVRSKFFDRQKENLNTPHVNVHGIAYICLVHVPSVRFPTLPHEAYEHSNGPYQLVTTAKCRTISEKIKICFHYIQLHSTRLELSFQSYRTCSTLQLVYVVYYLLSLFPSTPLHHGCGACRGFSIHWPCRQTEGSCVDKYSKWITRNEKPIPIQRIKESL